MLRVAWMSAEELGESVIFEQRCGVELRACDLMHAVVQTVAPHAERERSVLDGPDRSEVIAVGVVAWVIGGECANPPAAEQIGLEQSIDDAFNERCVADRRSDAMPGVRCDRAYLSFL